MEKSDSKSISPSNSKLKSKCAKVNPKIGLTIIKKPPWPKPVVTAEETNEPVNEFATQAKPEVDPFGRTICQVQAPTMALI